MWTKINGLILLAMVCATSAHADVCRPNGRDLTIAKPKGEYYAVLHGRTAVQGDRDCEEQAATWRLVDLIYGFRTLAPQAATRALTSLGLATGTTRIQVIPPYFGALQFPSGGVWDLAHHPQGRNYSTEYSSFAAFRADLLTAAKHGDATVRAILASSPDTRALLNLNDALDGPLYATDPDAAVVVDPHQADLFPVSTKKNLPPCGGGNGCAGDLDGNGVPDVDDTHVAHACSAAERIDCREPVGVAHVRYESGCGDDANCQWFRRMAAFSGLVDPGWSATERRQWKALTHVFHMAWSAGEQAGDTKAVTLNDHRHREAHLCLAIGTDDRLRVVMPADGIPASKFSESYGGDQPCRELLPKLVAAYGVGS